jgi:hypothetical protein
VPLVLHIEDFAAVALPRPQVGIAAFELDVDLLTAGVAVVVLVELVSLTKAVGENCQHVGALLQVGEFCFPAGALVSGCPELRAAAVPETPYVVTQRGTIPTPGANGKRPSRGR